MLLTASAFIKMERSITEEVRPKMGATITEEQKKALEFIEEFTSNADEVQRQVLTEILSQNATVDYLQRHGLDGHTDRDTFKKLIPVITYEHILPDINRIANGDKSPILCSQPISGFFRSTGTSGREPKLIPTVEKELRKKLQVRSRMKSSVIRQVHTDLGKGKEMYFACVKPDDETPGGLRVSSSTTYTFKNLVISGQNSTSPPETILCSDSYQSIYSQLLCGLSQNQQVYKAGSIFATGFIRAIRFLEKHWPLLCNDIRTGTISRTTDPSVREAVMKILKPDPYLADFIEAECSKDSWQGIVTRLWPNTKYIETIVTGAMSQYIPTLDYYTNSLPLVSATYSSSESFFGINLNPFCKPNEVAYTLIPTVCYFEFLPYQGNDGIIDSISMSNKEQQLVDLADVKIGQDYELVITTYSGLYRYRVGDVLRVAGFKNDAPQFNFLCRANVILSIDADQTNEAQLQNAVENAVSHLMPFDSLLTEYTSYVDTTTIPSHYVLFWELSVNGSTPIPASVFQDCCLTIEESLNFFYHRGRVSDKFIGPLEIRIVENGTFDKLMDYYVSLGATMSQYKTPRCLKFEPLIEIMNSRVTSSFFSPLCPKWVPSGFKK